MGVLFTSEDMRPTTHTLTLNLFQNHTHTYTHTLSSPRLPKHTHIHRIYFGPTPTHKYMSYIRYTTVQTYKHNIHTEFSSDPQTHAFFTEIAETQTHLPPHTPSPPRSPKHTHAHEPICK